MKLLSFIQPKATPHHLLPQSARKEEFSAIK
jgi:hypothetical protein